MDSDSYSDSEDGLLLTTTSLAGSLTPRTNVDSIDIEKERHSVLATTLESEYHDRLPIKLVEVANLANMGVDEGAIGVATVTMNSDSFICVRKPPDEVIVVDISTTSHDGVQSYTASARSHHGIVADRAILDPTGTALAVQVGQKLQLLHLASNHEVSSANLSSGLDYWAWLDTVTVAVVTKSEVLLWTPSNNSSPTPIFSRDASLAGVDVISCAVDPTHNFIAVSGVQLNGNAVVGYTQLYNSHTNESKVLDVHTVAIADLLLDNASVVSLLCHVGTTNNGYKLQISELQHPEVSRLQYSTKTATIEFSRGAETDFPVSVQCASVLKVVFILTKLGFVHVCDIETCIPIYTARVSAETLFVSFVEVSTSGILGINKTGQILSISMSESNTIDYILSDMKNADLARRFSRRAGRSRRRPLMDESMECVAPGFDQSGPASSFKFDTSTQSSKHVDAMESIDAPNFERGLCAPEEISPTQDVDSSIILPNSKSYFQPSDSMNQVPGEPRVSKWRPGLSGHWTKPLPTGGEPYLSSSVDSSTQSIHTSRLDGISKLKKNYEDRQLRKSQKMNIATPLQGNEPAKGIQTSMQLNRIQHKSLEEKLGHAHKQEWVLRAQLKEVESDRDRLKTQLSCMIENQDSLKAESSYVMKLRNQLLLLESDKRADAIRYDAAMKDLELNCSKKQNQLTTCQEDLTDAQAVIASQKLKIESLESELESMCMDNEQHVILEAEHKVQIEELQKHLQYKSSTIDDLQKDLEGLKPLEPILQASEADCKELSQSIAKISAEKAEAVDACERQAAQICDLTAKLESKVAQITELELELSLTDNQIHREQVRLEFVKQIDDERQQAFRIEIDALRNELMQSRLGARSCSALDARQGIQPDDNTERSQSAIGHYVSKSSILNEVSELPQDQSLPVMANIETTEAAPANQSSNEHDDDVIAAVTHQMTLIEQRMNEKLELLIDEIRIKSFPQIAKSVAGAAREITNEIVGEVQPAVLKNTDNVIESLATKSDTEENQLEPTSQIHLALPAVDTRDKSVDTHDLSTKVPYTSVSTQTPSTDESAHETEVTSLRKKFKKRETKRSQIYATMIKQMQKKFQEERDQAIHELERKNALLTSQLETAAKQKQSFIADEIAAKSCHPSELEIKNHVQSKMIEAQAILEEEQASILHDRVKATIFKEREIVAALREKYNKARLRIAELEALQS